jgi:hypothetical protein
MDSGQASPKEQEARRVPALRCCSLVGVAVLFVAGCTVSPPGSSGEPTATPTVTATPTPTAQPPSVAACPNFVEVVETGPLPGDDGTEDGPVAREQQRISGDVDLGIAYGADHPDEFASIRFENGPRVRMVIGFTAHIEEHCAALRAMLEYPDEFEIIRQPATELRLEQIQEALVARYQGLFRSVGRGAGVIHLVLRADGEDAAAEVHAEYGELVEITVGLLPYPDRFAGDPVCEPLVGPILADSQLVAVAQLDGPTVRTGLDFKGTVTVRNTGADAFDFQSGPRHAAVVFKPGSESPTGFWTGGMDAVGFGKRLAPGESVELELVGGTASCDPALGYALPPGQYEVRVPVVVLTDQGNAPTKVEYILSEAVPLTIVP